MQGTSTKASSYPYAESTPEITRSDFHRVDLKGMGGRYYYSYSDRWLGIELCLEACLNGFDVAMYNKDNFLIGKKICTNLKGPIFKDQKDQISEEEFIQRELRYGILERTEQVWDKALKIANRLLRSYRNQEKLKDWNVLPSNGNSIGDSDIQPKAVPPRYAFPGQNPIQFGTFPNTSPNPGFTA